MGTGPCLQSNPPPPHVHTGGGGGGGEERGGPGNGKRGAGPRINREAREGDQERDSMRGFVRKQLCLTCKKFGHRDKTGWPKMTRAWQGLGGR
jgi:hypothetical protein